MPSPNSKFQADGGIDVSQDQAIISSEQKCEDDAKNYMARFVENKSSSLVYELIREHQALVEGIREHVLNKYYIYRDSLNDEVNLEIPVDSDLMTKISSQIPKKTIPNRIIL